MSIPLNIPRVLQPIDESMTAILEKGDAAAFEAYFNGKSPSERGHIVDDVFNHVLKNNMVDNMVSILNSVPTMDLGLVNVDIPGSVFLPTVHYVENAHDLDRVPDIYQKRLKLMKCMVLRKNNDFLVAVVMRRNILVDNVDICAYIASNFPIKIWNAKRVDCESQRSFSTAITVAMDLSVAKYVGSQITEYDGIYSHHVNVKLVKYLLSFYKDWSDNDMYYYKAQFMRPSNVINAGEIFEIQRIVNDFMLSLRYFALGALLLKKRETPDQVLLSDLSMDNWKMIHSFL